MLTILSLLFLATPPALSTCGDYCDDDGDGYSGHQGDCNNNNAAVHPGAPEVENDVDDDCDGTVDEGTDAYDDDGDGYAENDGDCDDTDVAFHPGAAEVCNNDDRDMDYNCDGSTYHDDRDGDGSYACEDCNDAARAIHPGATEAPNGVDDDCDGTVDEGTDIYDGDGDGYTPNEGDCDDWNPRIYPGAYEGCNGVDDNCDGQIDEGLGDIDEAPNDLDDNCDGTVDEGTISGDDDGDGYAETEGDCDDADPAISPVELDVPDDGIDQDCSGVDATADTGEDVVKNYVLPPSCDSSARVANSSWLGWGMISLFLLALRRRR